jgi:hypothetical protein
MSISRANRRLLLAEGFWAGEAVFHCSNNCYRKADPKNAGSSFQCCYDKRGALVTKGSEGAGTYDYADYRLTPFRHFVKDMLPSIWYGDALIKDRK